MLEIIIKNQNSLILCLYDQDPFYTLTLFLIFVVLYLWPTVISGFLSLSMIVLKGVLQQKLKVLLVVKCWLYLV